MKFQLDQYLQRTGMNPADAIADLAGLQKLQLLQMKAVAFENIDVLTGQVPSLNDDEIWDKLLIQKRGGYCFELNHLFGHALDAIGFQSVSILGRVRMGAKVGGPRTHHAFVVTINGTDWLADAGFGGPAPTLPVNLDTTEIQDIRGELFRIGKDDASGEQVLERKTADGWFSLYGFDRVPVMPPDIQAANFLCARWDQSPFPVHLMMNIITEAGRVNLFNKQGKIIGNQGQQELLLGNIAELESFLKVHFRIEIDSQTLRTVWSRINAGQTGMAA